MTPTFHELSNLSEQIYSGYGFSENVGLRYFSFFLEQLLRFDNKDVLVHQIKEYPTQYVFDFLLSTPSLWTDLSGVDWVDIMRNVNPGCDPEKRENWDRYFTDIHFLCKYIGVDALERFLKEKSFDLIDKKRVLRYSVGKAILFSIDEIDAEDLDGEYFVDVWTINQVREKLISSGEFQELKMDNHDFVDYVRSLGRLYGAM